MKEFTQLNNVAMPGKSIVIPTNTRTTTLQEKNMALRALNLIKEKRSGHIKGSTCVNGSKQIKYLQNTAGLHSLFVTLLIHTYKEHDVVVCDIPGAYLQAKLVKKKNNGRTLMKLEGEFVDIMCEVNPEHKPNIIHKRGGKVLYLEILQAIYGCIESVLRLYDLYSDTLEKERPTINPYDKCVANKVIDGHQCTVVWYVDDNEFSHKDKSVADTIIQLMKNHFGEFNVTRGAEHSVLGINIRIRKDKKIEIEMKDQFTEAVNMFTEFKNSKIEETVVSPVQKNLRECNVECKKLSGTK